MLPPSRNELDQAIRLHKTLAQLAIRLGIVCACGAAAGLVLVGFDVKLGQPLLLHGLQLALFCAFAGAFEVWQLRRYFVTKMRRRANLSDRDFYDRFFSDAARRVEYDVVVKVRHELIELCGTQLPADRFWPLDDFQRDLHFDELLPNGVQQLRARLLRRCELDPRQLGRSREWRTLTDVCGALNDALHARAER
jgi:hypothetical protein